MPSFAPLHTGQFIIRPRMLKRTRLGWSMLVLIALAGLYGCFELGRWLSGYSVLATTRQVWQLRNELDAAHERIRALEKDVNRAQLTSQVDHQATAELQKSLSELQASMQSQNEELSFYRGIVAPQAGAATHPVVQQLRIQPARETHHYELQLVLIQSMQVTAPAQGNLRVVLSGIREGQRVQLSLKDLLPSQTDSLKFSYRYFQNLTQEIVLPADFEPEKVQVELRASAHPVQQQEFAWQTAGSSKPL